MVEQKEKLNKEMMILKCSSILGKIAANKILSNEEINKLSKELFALVYSNEEYNEQEEKMVGHKINKNGVEYAVNLEQFYNEKLKKYESYIDLLNIQVNNIEKLPENYEKFIKLSAQLKIYNLDIDMEKYTEILFALLMNELTFFNTKSILDSLSETDILLITEYIKKQLPESSELHTRLEKDIIDKEELYDILNTFSNEKKYFGNIDFKTYNEVKKKELEERLKELSKDRIATIKAIETFQTINDLGKLEQLNKEIDELYSLKKEEKQKLKKRMIKKVIANSPSRIKFIFNNNYRAENIANAGHIGLLAAAIIFSCTQIELYQYVYTNKTETINTINNEIKTRESKKIFNKKITPEEAIPEIKLTYYTPWVFNGTEYQREVIRYSIKDIDLEKLEDYLNLDLDKLQMVEKQIEKATNLNENNLYSEDYFELEKNEIITGDEEISYSGLYSIVFFIAFLSEFILACSKELLSTYDITSFKSKTENYAIGSIISLIKELSKVQIKIEKKEKITQEDINNLKESINKIEKEIEEKLKEKNDIQNSEQKIKELQTKLEAINKLLKAFENPEMIYTVNPNEHVYQSLKEEKEEGYAPGI